MQEGDNRECRCEAKRALVPNSQQGVDRVDCHDLLLDDELRGGEDLGDQDEHDPQKRRFRGLLSCRRLFRSAQTGYADDCEARQLAPITCGSESR